MTRNAILIALACLLGASVASAQGTSPALCSPIDNPEPGIQGDAAPAEGYGCGLSLLAEIGGGGSGVQGAGHCAYLRIGGGSSTGAQPDPNVQIRVFDLSDPTAPAELDSLQPISGSETMRAVTTAERSVLVNGRSVYDVSDCGSPVLKGEIEWPGLTPWPMSGYHDVRISHDGKRVYAGIFTIEVDISDLDDPSKWTVKNHTCAVSDQAGNLIGLTTEECEEAFEFASGSEQYAHGPDENGDGTRWYIGGQGATADPATLRILDRTVDPVQIVSPTQELPGHSIDWFRIADGREFLLHANEFGNFTTCTPHPRPTSLGWAYQAYITDLADEQAPTLASLVKIAINEPEFCQQRDSSGHNPWIAYHSVDDPFEAHFAMVSFGSAGIRVFDIRDPYAPSEVAYFNKGSVAHAGVSWYDAQRGLILIPSGGLKVLEIQPQVFDALGMPYPSDPAYPRALPEPGLAASLAAGGVLLGALRRRRRIAQEPSATTSRTASAISA